MRLLDPTWIRDNVDYSFGDESGMGIGGYMKVANSANGEFIQKYHQLVSEGHPYMTLFIDNMRLYQRPCYRYTAVEKHNMQWKEIRDSKVRQFSNEDLLRLCASLPDMQFIIFTGFEDMPIDEGIWNAIPDNVLGIYACNCMVWGQKVYPFPYGLQRLTAPNDYRQQAILEMIDIQIQPQKLMYINFNVGNHPTRGPLVHQYQQYPWVTVHTPGMGLVYQEAASIYYTHIKSHKFMLCPSGNADGSECHRDWEAIYMRRVPIVQDTPYLREIFKGIPVLYMNNLLNVTEQLLIDNDYLYQQIQTFDMNRLDIEKLYNKCIDHALESIVAI